MKGTKMQSGITLIVLIITIVVLVILAGVAISVIQDSGILIHVDRSVIMHEVGTISEKIRLESQAIALDAAQGGNKTQTVGNVLTNLYADDNITPTQIEIESATSIPEGITPGKYYIAIPEYLDYNISRGKGFNNDPLSGDIFVVDKDFNVYYLTKITEKTITGGGENPLDDIPDNLKRYILGNDFKGKELFSLINGEMSGFVDDGEAPPDEDESQTVQLIIFEVESPTKVLFKIQYTVNGRYYKFKTDMTDNPMTDPVYGLREYVPGEFNLEEYWFGEDRLGRNTDYMTEVPEVENIARSTNDGMGEIEEFIYFKYQGVIHKVKLNKHERYVEEDQKTYTDYYTDPEYGIVELYKEEDQKRLGQYVKYGGDLDKDEKDDLWIIIYDDNEHGIQMVSQNTYKYLAGEDLYLGDMDSLADWDSLKNKVDSDGKKIVDLDNNGELSETEKIIYSYNNAISTLNTACDEIVPYSDKIQAVRCIGSNPDPDDINSENSTLYSTKNADNKLNKTMKSEDTNYSLDHERMSILKILEAKQYDTGRKTYYPVEYWIASRKLEETETSCYFKIRTIEREAWTLDSQTLIYSSSTYADTNNDHPNNALRPVIILKDGVEFTGGTGTSDNPYTF